MLQNNPKLKALIVSLWNTFWSGGISNPITVIEQITYLLFIKRIDELESKRERDAYVTRKISYHIIMSQDKPESLGGNQAA